MAGETKSGDFLTQAHPPIPSFQPAISGTSDAFLSKLGPLLAFNVTVATSPSTTVSAGNQVTFTYTIENHGDFTSGITFTDNLGSGRNLRFGDDFDFGQWLRSTQRWHRAVQHRSAELRRNGGHRRNCHRHCDSDAHRQRQPRRPIRFFVEQWHRKRLRFNLLRRRDRHRYRE